MKETLEWGECFWRPEVKGLHIFRDLPSNNAPYSQVQWNTGLILAGKQADYTEPITFTVFDKLRFRRSMQVESYLRNQNTPLVGVTLHSRSSI